MTAWTRRTALALSIAAAALAAAPVSAQTITMWHIFGAPTEPGLVNIKRWNDANPSAQIDHKFIPFGQLSQQLIKGIATGDVPDLITIDNPTTASFATQGALEDLTDLTAKSGVIKAANFYKGSWGITQWKGRQWAIPGEANTIALYYNADMFKAKGLDPDKPPKTWSELLAATEKLTDKSKNVYGLGFSAIQSEEGTFQWLPWLEQAGGSINNLNSPEAVAALQVWTDLVAKEQVSKDALIKRQFEMTSSWIGGASAMVISGPWELQRTKDVKFDWRVAPLPVRDGKNIQASALGGYVWGIPKGAKNKEGAFKVIEFMLMPAQMAQVWLGGRLPPSPNVVIDNPQFPAAYAAFKTQMEFARPRGPHPDWPVISAAIQTAIQEALTGRAKPAQALEKASKVVGPLLQKTPLAPAAN
jgi:multiple sugar transport system substrate-binding protein